MLFSSKEFITIFQLRSHKESTSKVTLKITRKMYSYFIPIKSNSAYLSRPNWNEDAEKTIASLKLQLYPQPSWFMYQEYVPPLYVTGFA